MSANVTPSQRAAEANAAYGPQFQLKSLTEQCLIIALRPLRLPQPTTLRTAGAMLRRDCCPSPQNAVRAACARSPSASQKAAMPRAPSPLHRNAPRAPLSRLLASLLSKAPESCLRATSNPQLYGIDRPSLRD